MFYLFLSFFVVLDVNKFGYTPPITQQQKTI